MEFTDDAKRDIEQNLNEIVKNVNADGKELTDIERELRSNYYEAAESAAKSRGAESVTTDDVKTAAATMVSPAETAECLMKSYGSSLKKAGFWYRLAAYIIDSIIIGAVVLVLMLPTIALRIGFSNVFNDTMNYTPNPLMMAAFFTIMACSVASAIFAYIGYYFLVEGHYGYTIGKYLLGLRVLKTDGTKISYRESLLRNIPKYIRNLIVLDALIMLIFFNKEKQRGFDKVANTMVVHARG
jgi:uncharacterized RDD family membrane protein YckC